MPRADSAPVRAAPQVVGGRATRTTHPQVLNGFSEIFSAIFQKPFAVENPFCWMTKAEVVKSIRDRGCGDLIKHTVSCTHVWEMTKLKTHCGTCSQCIDRRFGTLSAGCSDSEDPEEMYDVDLLRGERAPGESRTMLESYVGMAKRVRSMSDTAFFTEFGEVHRVTQHIQGMNVHECRHPNPGAAQAPCNGSGRSYHQGNSGSRAGHQRRQGAQHELVDSGFAGRVQKASHVHGGALHARPRPR